MGDMAAETRADAGNDPVRMSQAAVKALYELPRSQTGAVADAIERIRRGERGQALKFSTPGTDDDAYWAMKTTSSQAPVVIYRVLSEDEGGGFLVTALVGGEDFKAYEVADQKGLLDKPLGRLFLGGAAAAGAVVAARDRGRGY